MLRYGLRERFAHAWRHTGIRRRDLIIFILGSIVVYLALSEAVSSEEAKAEVVALGAAALVGVLVVLAEFAWNFKVAPYRLEITRLSRELGNINETGSSTGQAKLEIRCEPAKLADGNAYFVRVANHAGTGADNVTLQIWGVTPEVPNADLLPQRCKTVNNELEADINSENELTFRVGLAWLVLQEVDGSALVEPRIWVLGCHTERYLRLEFAGQVRQYRMRLRATARNAKRTERDIVVRLLKDGVAIRPLKAAE